jgi:hypothetical protein
MSSVSSASTPVASPPFVCVVCNCSVQSSDVERMKHFNGKKHLKNVAKSTVSSSSSSHSSSSSTSVGSASCPDFVSSDCTRSPSQTVNVAPTDLRSVSPIYHTHSTDQANGSTSKPSKTYLNGLSLAMKSMHLSLPSDSAVHDDDQRNEADIPHSLALSRLNAGLDVDGSVPLQHHCSSYEPNQPLPGPVSRFFCLPCMKDYYSASRLSVHFET